MLSLNQLQSLCRDLAKMKLQPRMWKASHLRPKLRLRLNGENLIQAARQKMMGPKPRLILMILL